jgi:hypothetical protein
VLAHFIDDCGLKGFHHHPLSLYPFLTSHDQRHDTTRRMTRHAIIHR